MPSYNDLRPSTDEKKAEYAQVFPSLTDTERKRIISRLLPLRSELTSAIPSKRTDDNLLLATWNLKEFGFYTDRLAESYYYIAEIISRFDLVAIQEVKRGLRDLDILMRLLGTDWKYIITDVTEGVDGNRERFAYVYDSRRVQPSGLSGELVLWEELTASSGIKQLKRTPAITGFIAGWKEFAIVNVHLCPGPGPQDREYRQEEVRLLLQAIHEKYVKGHLWNENLLLLGDTNLYRSDSDTVALFSDNQFRESSGLAGKFTNVSNTEIYDRIFLRVNEFFRLKSTDNVESGNVLSFFDHVFTENERAAYHAIMREHKTNPATLKEDKHYKSYYHRYWKRNQISDHNPVWIEIEINSSDDFLKKKLQALKDH
ncbi:MAG: endonuclease/exonuclease/phosphatase family protein [Bacteroidia bacterium]